MSHYDWCPICDKRDPRAKYHSADCDYARRPRTVRSVPVGITSGGEIVVDAGPQDGAGIAEMMAARKAFREQVEEAFERGDSSEILRRIDAHIEDVSR